MSMGNPSFSISYKISKLGALAGKSAGELTLLEITNYSLEGELEIARDGAKITLVEVPLLETFHAIRQVLKIVPIFASSVPYAQMFREARTLFIVDSETLTIEHREIAPLRTRSGLARLSGGYVDFCTSFGSAAKDFVCELERIAPSLFSDQKTTTQFADLFVGVKISDSDPAIYSVV
jgi:hypothetical protein